MQRRVYTNQMLIRGIAKLLVETVYSIVAFKIVVFFVSLKEELHHKSTPEMLELLGSQKVFFVIRNAFYEDWLFIWEIQTVMEIVNSSLDIISTVAKRVLKRSRDGA